MSAHIYTTLWNKYRPAIIQLMLASAHGPQQYRFFDHEFKGLNPKERNYAFELHVFQGKALNNIKSSATAQQLLGMLRESRRAIELMDERQFEFAMDKQFVLHVKRLAPKEGASDPSATVSAL